MVGCYIRRMDDSFPSLGRGLDLLAELNFLSPAGSLQRPLGQKSYLGGEHLQTKEGR